MRETNIENYLVRSVEKVGGQALKFNSSKRGMPDRIVLLPGGKIFFVETKAPGKKARVLQEKRLRDLINLGFHAEVVDTKEKVDLFIGTVST